MRAEIPTLSTGKHDRAAYIRLLEGGSAAARGEDRERREHKPPFSVRVDRGSGSCPWHSADKCPSHLAPMLPESVGQVKPKPRRRGRSSPLGRRAGAGQKRAGDGNHRSQAHWVAQRTISRALIPSPKPAESPKRGRLDSCTAVQSGGEEAYGPQSFA